MIKKYFKVTLQSDVILNQKAATAGANATLDFIPGNCFLGIVAGKLYKEGTEESINLFHGKKVFFGDAHPAIGDVRTLRVPAALYYPKLSSADKECYVHHLIPADKLMSKEMRALQLKQCRNGFYNLNEAQAEIAITDKSTAIKSAHDKDKRTSKDEQLFSYEALQKGLKLYFEVCIDESLENRVADICDALCGERHVGRSRTAQYGLVKIEETTYSDAESHESTSEETVVYADGRLIFIDRETGLPTLQPSAENLGIDGGEILWEKCQVRTFCYAPWNFKRQSFDADRCGFEKGSVFVVKGSPKNTESTYIGNYNNEGFGKVIYNPSFLCGDNKTGLADIRLAKIENKKQNTTEKTTSDTPLFEFLMSEKKADSTNDRIIDIVNHWIEDKNENNLRRFKGDKFPSQWGTIRSLASLKKSTTPIWDRLFKEKEGYLVHGVAAEKWRELRRVDELKSFLDNFDNEADKRSALVNLAAEMAKRLKKEEKNG